MNSGEYNRGHIDGLAGRPKKENSQENEEYMAGYNAGLKEKRRRANLSSGRLKMVRWRDGSASFWSP